MSEHLKNWEQEIRFNERAVVTAKIAKELEVIHGALQRLSLWMTPSDPSSQENRRRKPVEATAEQVQAVINCFRDAQTPLTVTYLTQVVDGLGLRTAAAACRELVARGRLQTVGKQGFQAIKPNHQEAEL